MICTVVLLCCLITFSCQTATPKTDKQAEAIATDFFEALLFGESLENRPPPELPVVKLPQIQPKVDSQLQANPPKDLKFSDPFMGAVGGFSHFADNNNPIFTPHFNGLTNPDAQKYLAPGASWRQDLKANYIYPFLPAGTAIHPDKRQGDIFALGADNLAVLNGPQPQDDLPPVPATPQPNSQPGNLINDVLKNFGLGRGFVSTATNNQVVTNNQVEPAKKLPSQFIVHTNKPVSVERPTASWLKSFVTAPKPTDSNLVCPVCLDVTLSKTRGIWTQISKPMLFPMRSAMMTFVILFLFSIVFATAHSKVHLIRKRQNSQMNLAALSALAGLNQMPSGNGNNFGQMSSSRSGSFLPFNSQMSGGNPFDSHNNFGSSGGFPNGVNLQSTLGSNPLMSSMMMSSGGQNGQIPFGQSNGQMSFGQNNNNNGQMPMMSNMFPSNDQTVDVNQYRALMSALSSGNGNNGNNNNNFMPQSFGNPQSQSFQNFGQPGMNLNSMMGSSPVLRDQSQFMGGNSDVLNGLGNQQQQQLPNNNFFPNNNGNGAMGGSVNPNLMFGMSNPYASVQTGYNRATPQESSMNLLSALIANNLGSFGQSNLMPPNNNNNNNNNFGGNNNMRMNMPMPNQQQQQSNQLSSVGMQVRVVQVPLQNGVSVPVFQLVGNDNINHKQRARREVKRITNHCGCEYLKISRFQGTWTQIYGNPDSLKTIYTTLSTVIAMNDGEKVGFDSEPVQPSCVGFQVSRSYNGSLAPTRIYFRDDTGSRKLIQAEGLFTKLPGSTELNFKLSGFNIPMCVIKAGTSPLDQSYNYLVMTETSGSNKCRNLHVFARKVGPFLKENNAEVASFLQKEVLTGNRNPVSFMPFPELCEVQ